jgi:hypothetical protein
MLMVFGVCVGDKERKKEDACCSQSRRYQSWVRLEYEITCTIVAKDSAKELLSISYQSFLES